MNPSAVASCSHPRLDLPPHRRYTWFRSPRYRTWTSCTSSFSSRSHLHPRVGAFRVREDFGVKVLTFSIGFGPKVLRLRGKETEYCVGAPAVRRVREDARGEQAAREPILPEERHRTFEAQALWKRVVIVLAGPAMNLLFPIALYTCVFLDDDAFLPPTVGVVLPASRPTGSSSRATASRASTGTPSRASPRCRHVIAARAGQRVTLDASATGESIDVTITPADEAEERELDIVEHVGASAIAPRFPAAVIGVARRDSPAAARGSARSTGDGRQRPRSSASSTSSTRSRRTVATKW